jgi:hypothetical protein
MGSMNADLDKISRSATSRRQKTRLRDNKGSNTSSAIGTDPTWKIGFYEAA